MKYSEKMIKFVEKDTIIGFREIPTEITLCLNISNCCHNCKGCHSQYLQTDIGAELTPDVVDKLISENDGITCICLMGEGNDPDALRRIIQYIHDEYRHKVKVALYSGRECVDEDWPWEILDYLKIGSYKEEFGPLDKKTTNQRLYFGGPYYSWCCEVNGKIRYGWKDITNKFWK